MRATALLAFLALVLAGTATARTIVGTAKGEALSGTASADSIRGGAGNDRLTGGRGADFLDGGPGRDRVDAGDGADRITVEYDGSRDRVSCGRGLDAVTADLVDTVAGDCELVSRRLSRDPYVDPDGQHESEVEPDSFTFGRTTVATFQVARRNDGGATNVGFAVSKDDGRSWRSGFLPGITVAGTPAGTAPRASDPSVAYDSVHGVWLISTLAIEGEVTRLTISRSSDGLTWSNPVFAAEASSSSDIAFDKEWIGCDNGGSSPFRGRCHLVYSDVQHGDVASAKYSQDGGLTWSPQVQISQSDAVGVIPVVRPNGELVVVYLAQGRRVDGALSTNGGATFGAPVTVAPVTAHAERGLRFIPLPSADVDASGRVFVTWHDCRFSRACAANSVVVATSADGRTWDAATAATTGRDAVIPTIGIDSASGRAAIAYYTVRPAGIDLELVESRSGRSGWSAPRRVSTQTMRVPWLPTTSSGRMLADYISLHYAAGRPQVVWALASPPVGGGLKQAIYATRG
jgi:RTX calcium-binding nonapeptide repeat (4 copies)